MTPQVHEAYQKLKDLTESMAVFLELWEMEREAFERSAKPYADGTMDVILPHFMSMREMEASQLNLRKAIRVSRLLGELRGLLCNQTKETKA